MRGLIRGIAITVVVPGAVLGGGTINATAASSTIQSGNCYFGYPIAGGYRQGGSVYVNAHGCNFGGHYHIWGNGLDENTPEIDNWDYDRYSGTYAGWGYDLICIEAWEWIGHWNSLGRWCGSY